VTYFGLADAMNTAKTLLNAIGVPRQVIVHHQVCALEVDASPAHPWPVNLHFGVVLE